MRRGVCGLVVVALVAAWPVDAAEQKCVLQRIAELPVTMSGTRPLITGEINGKPARFLADSGAFFSVLTRESAAKHELKLQSLPPGFIVRGTGGTERMQLAKVPEFVLNGFAGGRTYTKVDFLVGASRFGGDIDGIIGQNFIGTADTEYDLANGFIRLFQPKDCNGATLAYWGAGAKIAELEFKRRTPAQPLLIANARINGKKIRVMFDSGAFRSILTRRAAAKACCRVERRRCARHGIGHRSNRSDSAERRHGAAVVAGLREPAASRRGLGRTT
jgi:hypothetical protein